MENTIFEKLRELQRTHKAVANGLGITSRAYSNWRNDPNNMPEYAKRYLKLYLEHTKQKALDDFKELMGIK